MKRCIVCGNVSDDESAACAICGSTFFDESGASQHGAEQEQAEPFIGETDLTGPESAETIKKEQPDGEGLKEKAGKAPADTEADNGERNVRLSDDLLFEGIEMAAPVEEPSAESVKKLSDDLLLAGFSDTSQKETGASDEAAGDIPASEEVEAAENSVPETTDNSVSEPETAEDHAAEPEAVENSIPEPVQAENKPEKPAGGIPREQFVGNPEGMTGEQPETPDGRYPQHPSRMKSGPHIYGQSQTDAGAYAGAQGVIRRDVRGGHASGPAGRMPGNVPSQYAGAVQRNPQSRVNVLPGENPVRQQMGPQNTGRLQNGMMNGGAQPQPGGMMQRMPGNASGPDAGMMPGGMQGRGMMIPGQGRPVPGRMPGEMPIGRPAGETGVSGRIAETARGLLGSPMFLFIALLQTVALASAVGAIFLQQLNYSQIARLLAEFDFPAQVSGYVNSAQNLLAKLDSGAIAVNLAMHIPDLLLFFGLWIVWIAAKCAKKGMSGAGFVFMKLVVIIHMIIACVVLLVLLVLSVTVVIATWSARTDSMIVTAVVMLVAAVIVTMAVIMYYFCYLATIRTFRTNAVSGELYGKASAYVALVHMILAVPSVISILSGIVNLEITGITGGIGTLGWMLLFGIWIFRYRSRMNEYED